jgi:hypothetical protein
MKNQSINQIIIELGQRLKLIKEDQHIKVCNFANNYYGDQKCCEISQVRLSKR